MLFEALILKPRPSLLLLGFTVKLHPALWAELLRCRNLEVSKIGFGVKGFRCRQRSSVQVVDLGV